MRAAETKATVQEASEELIFFYASDERILHLYLSENFNNIVAT